MTVIKGFIHWLADTHIIISVAAAAFTWSAFQQIGQPAPVSLILLTGFATLATYNFQNLLRRQAPHRLDNLRSSWTHLIPALTGLTGTLTCLLQSSPELIIWLIPPAVISALYAIPIFPFRGQKIALRAYPGIKIGLILLVWLWVTALIPLSTQSTLLDVEITLFLFQRGAFLMALLIPFDIRDLKTDYSFQYTLPQVFGIRWSLIATHTFAILYMVLVLIRFMSGAMPVDITLALLVTGVLTLAIVSVTSTERSDYFFTVGIDSLLWIQALIIWLFTL